MAPFRRYLLCSHSLILPLLAYFSIVVLLFLLVLLVLFCSVHELSRKQKMVLVKPSFVRDLFKNLGTYLKKDGSELGPIFF